jgi:alpha/beta superfamily hydrolase
MSETFYIQGEAGKLECLLDLPNETAFPQPTGIALVAHPHPLRGGGGTMHHKIVHILMRAFVSLGFATARMNFRGVGGSEGVHDEGRGETDDMALLAEEMERRFPGLPLEALGGFSFGTFVQAELQRRLAAQGKPARRMALVGAAAGPWAMGNVPANTILIHGEQDDVILLSDVFDWARPQNLPVIVVPGAGHFLHGKMPVIKEYVMALWHMEPSGA